MRRFWLHCLKIPALGSVRSENREHTLRLFATLNRPSTSTSTLTVHNPSASRDQSESTNSPFTAQVPEGQKAQNEKKMKTPHPAVHPD